MSFGGYAGRPGQLEGVGFWPRAGARALDLLVHFIATYSAGFAFGIFIGIAAVLAHGTENAAPYVQAAVGKLQGATLLPFMAGLVGATVYEIVCEAGHGSTLGKMLLGMTVVREDGGFCGLKAATVRSLGYYVDALFFGVVGVVDGGGGHRGGRIVLHAGFPASSEQRVVRREFGTGGQGRTGPLAGTGECPAQRGSAAPEVDGDHLEEQPGRALGG